MDRKRVEIAILYQFTRNWVAGAYYIQNLIVALNTLNDENKPLINVYCNGKEYFQELKETTDYPYLVEHFYDFKEKYFLVKVLNKFKALLDYNHYKKTGALNLSKTDNVLVYPVSDLADIKFFKHTLVWIPDFQEKYLPSLFSQKDLFFRKKMQECYVNNNVPIVFSSKDSENDFKKFYPKANNKTFVLQFAVFHPDFSEVSINVLRAKYNILGDYFFCANQFWKHKNHLFLFKAYKQYLDQGGRKLLVCSGALSDFRNKSYNNEIKQFIYDNRLENKIKILGFIDRLEQLCLMNKSYAIIQPSLFEGWSTVVEDAKKLNKFIFLSNLRVHIEQNPVNVCYFDPYDITDIVSKLLNVKPTAISNVYDSNMVKFGKDFFEIINILTRKKCLGEEDEAK